MADLSSIIKQKAERDGQWKAQRQAERENTTAMQDAAVELITTDPDSFMRYLTMQGDNPTYSVGNVAIALVGMEDATIIGTAERWRSLGRTVNEGEVGVKIFARDQRTRQYTLTEAFDIAQTHGQDLKRRIIRDDTPEMSTALSTLLNFSKTPASEDKSLGSAAFFDEGDKAKDIEPTLAINPDYPDSEAFATIAAEVALTRFHDKGRNPDYSWDRYDLDAKSVSYILCRRFGIEPKAPKLEELADRFANMTPQEAREVLDKIQDMSKQIGRSIDKALDEKQRTRPTTRRPSR